MKQMIECMGERTQPCDRRAFLKKAGLITAGIVAGRLGGEVAWAQAEEAVAKAMPTLPFGSHRISRLVLGSNPVRGTTHTLPEQMNQALKEFYTVHRAVQLLRRCEQVGINYFQTEPTPVVLEALRRYRELDGKLQFMATVTGGMARNPQLFEDMFACGPTSATIMGETTDWAYKRGQMERVHDMLKMLHDRGFYAGVNTHMPVTLEYMEEKGWETDFYMACAYNIRRTPEEWKQVLGPELPLYENYLPGDPARLCAVVRQIPKPCLIFKILAAGRLARRPQSREAAFKFIFENIKPIDAVCVGMSIMFTDEPKEDAELTIKYGSSPAAA